MVDEYQRRKVRSTIEQHTSSRTQYILNYYIEFNENNSIVRTIANQNININIGSGEINEMYNKIQTTRLKRRVMSYRLNAIVYLLLGLYSDKCMRPTCQDRLENVITDCGVAQKIEHHDVKLLKTV